ncbi:MAG: diacylglycerol/polyprenol kinase family protein [Fidelibacterota bacterium]
MKSIPTNEVTRKILHLFSSIIPLGYVWFIQDKEIMVVLLGCLSLIAILLEISRKKWDIVESLFEKHFNFMLRQSEFDEGLTGATWLLFGSTITLYLFPIQIAVPSLLFLTVGDAFAAIIGKGIPVGKIGDKHLSGTIAGIVTSCGIALWINQHLPGEIIILSSVASMLVEVAPLPMNDNLTIPLTGGLVMSYGMMVL